MFNLRNCISCIPQIPEVRQIPLTGGPSQKVYYGMVLICWNSSQYHIVVISMNGREFKLAHPRNNREAMRRTKGAMPTTESLRLLQ